MQGKMEPSLLILSEQSSEMRYLDKLIAATNGDVGILSISSPDEVKTHLTESRGSLVAIEAAGSGPEINLMLRDLRRIYSGPFLFLDPQTSPWRNFCDIGWLESIDCDM